MCVSEQWKIVFLLGFTTGPSLNDAERQPITASQDEINYQQQQMLNGQYHKIIIN
jgi:hypothetical protein